MKEWAIWKQQTYIETSPAAIFSIIKTIRPRSIYLENRSREYKRKIVLLQRLQRKGRVSLTRILVPSIAVFAEDLRWYRT